jgi:hypothetical protein
MMDPQLGRLVVDIGPSQDYPYPYPPLDPHSPYPALENHPSAASDEKFWEREHPYPRKKKDL